MINGKITNIIEIYPIPGEEFSSMEEGGGGAGEGFKTLPVWDRKRT